MPYLKFAALMLLVILLGVPANSAGPDSPSLSEDAPMRLNLEYLAPEVRSVFGPDTYLAAPPIWPVDPIEDPRGACYKTCHNESVYAKRACESILSDPDLNEFSRVFLYQICLSDAEQEKEACIARDRCALIPA